MTRVRNFEQECNFYDYERIKYILGCIYFCVSELDDLGAEDITRPLKETIVKLSNAVKIMEKEFFTYDGKLMLQ